MFLTPRLRSPLRPAALLLALGLLAGAAAQAQDLDAFEERITLHRLDNGWTFLIAERPGAPTFSFVTVADVGGAQEVPGITGLAHMFEHMAFKGTDVVGSTDFTAEQEALTAMEAAYQAWQAERLEGQASDEELARLYQEFERLREVADEYAVPGAYGELLAKEGVAGLNATTRGDATLYYYSLPANKIELFAYLESERFLKPVLREFYEERDVVQEERRMRTESSPIGRMVEQFLSSAYDAHPYGQPIVGHMSDLESLTITDAQEFFDTYYGPSNLITAIVGNVDTDATIDLVERYFGRIPARPDPPEIRTVEPPQIAEKVVVIEDAAQPFYLEGYHKPAETHPDQAVYDAIDSILTGGRTSRLYRRLVEGDKTAVAVQSFSGFPGPKYPNLWALLAIPAQGQDIAVIQTALREEMERLKDEPVSAEELARFKTNTRADLLRSLRSDSNLAELLVEHQRLYGDWRALFESLERIEAVTPEAIQRVAGETLRAKNRTIVRIENVPAEGESR
jgi:predicted Zn-dependent peptidase